MYINQVFARQDSVVVVMYDGRLYSELASNGVMTLYNSKAAVISSFLLATADGNIMCVRSLHV